MPSPRSRAPSPKSESARGVGGPPLALGVDLGATKVVSVLTDPSGRVVFQGDRLRHGNEGPSGVHAVVVRSARQCLDGLASPPRAMGISIAAQVDPDRGTVRSSPNLGWRDLAWGASLRDELGYPVRLVNDARAATYAEWRFGAGRGETDLFGLVLGTGVGGSAVVGGVLLDGGSHALGEVGHLTIRSGGRKCSCPNSGCFEAYVGGWAIAARAREAVAASGAEGAALAVRKDPVEGITAETVFEAARTGDPLAVRLVRETDEWLCDGAVTVVNAFNPSVLVLAGGLLEGRPEWVPRVQRAVRDRCPPAAAGARVVAAEFGPLAGAVGAAELARAQVGRRTPRARA
ncbi:MAG: ROK family protein [Thermoplasmata archaeon]